MQAAGTQGVIDLCGEYNACPRSFSSSTTLFPHVTLQYRLYVFITLPLFLSLFLQLIPIVKDYDKKRAYNYRGKGKTLTLLTIIIMWLQLYIM